MSMPKSTAAQNFAASLGQGDTAGSALPSSLTPSPSAGAHQGSAWLHVELTPVEPAQSGETAKLHSHRASPDLVIPSGVSRPGWRPAGHLLLQFIPYLTCPQQVPLTPKHTAEVLEPSLPPSLSRWKELQMQRKVISIPDAISAGCLMLPTHVHAGLPIHLPRLIGTAKIYQGS